MGRLRRHITWIVCGWLCCQLAVLTAAPLSLSANAEHAADSMSCTCVHTGNAQCPMHHPARPKPACECRNTSDPDAATIVSLLGPIAVLSDTAVQLTALPITQLPDYSVSRFTHFLTAPDGPPPRG
jgi:hypothetical protein